MAVSEQAQIAGVRIKEMQGRDVGDSIMRWDAYRSSDEGWFKGYGDCLAGVMNKGAVWPFHFHKDGVDTFAVISGKARVILYDMREDSPTKGKTWELDCDGDVVNVQFIQLPPMIAHAFQGLSERSVLIDLPSSEAVATTDFNFNDPGSVPYEFKQV